jgi:uncharacterized membrane protein
VSWSRRYAVISYLQSAIWTVPVFALLLEQATFRIAHVHQVDFGGIPGFILDRAGSLAETDYIIASAIAFTVFTFSSLIVAIQVASGQLTPRIIATTLLRDKAIRRSVALFIYTLLLAVHVKTRIDEVPRSVTSLLGILGLLSVIVFMFLIDYAARMLRPVSIVWHVAQQGLKVIDEVYPNETRAPSAPPRVVEKLGAPELTVLHGGSSAIVIAVNLPALLIAARKADAIIEVVPRVGDFVARDDPLFRLHGRGAATLDPRLLHAQVALGRERTIEQDSTFAFRVIVDIALKALSAAINDPTTATLAIDQLQRLLRAVGKRDLRDDRILDDAGRLRVVSRTPNWDDFVQLTFCEIRQCGAGNIQVVRRLRAMIDNVLQNLPEQRWAAVREQSDLLDRAAERAFAFPEDLALARVADSQGLGGAAEQ